MSLCGKRIVNFGDSIFANTTETGVSNFIAKYTGAEVYNCAFGGTRMQTREYESPYEHFDLRSLIDSFVTKNYAPQDKALIPDADGKIFSADYVPVMERVKKLELTNQIVTFNNGTNDWTGETPMPLYKESIKHIISQLKKNFPDVHIVLCSPTWRCTFEGGAYIPGGNDTRINGIGLTNYDFVIAMRDVAEELNIDFIDCYNIGINETNCLNYFNGKDGTHHDERGREYLAKHISKELEKIIK